MKILMRNREEQLETTAQLRKADLDYIHEGETVKTNHFKRGHGAVRLIGFTFILKPSAPTVNWHRELD